MISISVILKLYEFIYFNFLFFISLCAYFPFLALQLFVPCPYSISSIIFIIFGARFLFSSLLHLVFSTKYYVENNQNVENMKAFQKVGNHGGRAKAGNMQWVMWRKRETGWCALDTDVCVTPKENKAGCGGKIRDDTDT